MAMDCRNSEAADDCRIDVSVFDALILLAGRKWLIFASLVCGSILGFMYEVSKPRLYEAKTVVFYSSSSGGAIFGELQSIARVTQASLVSQLPACRNAGANCSASFEFEPTTPQFFSLKFLANTPQLAQDGANQWFRNYLKESRATGMTPAAARLRFWQRVYQLNQLEVNRLAAELKAYPLASAQRRWPDLWARSQVLAQYMLTSDAIELPVVVHKRKLRSSSSISRSSSANPADPVDDKLEQWMQRRAYGQLVGALLTSQQMLVNSEFQAMPAVLPSTAIQGSPAKSSIRFALIGVLLSVVLILGSAVFRWVVGQAGFKEKTDQLKAVFFSSGR